MISNPHRPIVRVYKSVTATAKTETNCRDNCLKKNNTNNAFPLGLNLFFKIQFRICYNKRIRSPKNRHGLSQTNSEITRHFIAYKVCNKLVRIF